jgi:hypothetical protein
MLTFFAAQGSVLSKIYSAQPQFNAIAYSEHSAGRKYKVKVSGHKVKIPLKTSRTGLAWRGRRLFDA